MKSSTKITQLKLLFFISSIATVNCIHPMEQELSIVSCPYNNEINVESKDPFTPVQFSYGTQEYSPSLRRTYVKDTAIQMSIIKSDSKHCLIAKKPDKSSVITFYVQRSQEKEHKVTAYDCDEFTIHPRTDDTIIITKQNHLRKIPATEVVRFTFKSPLALSK